MNEKLEKLNQEIAKTEKKLRRAQHEEKILEQNIYQTSKGLILQGFREDSKRIYYQFTTSKTTMICLHTIEN